jgi:hypothetical protein
VSRVRVNASSINFRINAGVVVPRNYSMLSISAYPALYEIYPDIAMTASSSSMTR